MANAMLLGRLPRHAIRNWMTRSGLNVGQKQPSGRWLYSIRDVAELAIMQRLCGTQMSFTPDAATYLAADAVAHGIDSIITRGRGVLRLIVAWDEDGDVVASLIRVGQVPSLPTSGGFNPMHWPYVVIPCTEIVADIMQRAARDRAAGRLAKVAAAKERPAPPQGGPVNMISFDFS